MTAPDKVGVILGYRVWSLNTLPDAEHRLHAKVASGESGSLKAPWSATAPTHSECCRCEASPSFNCRCGLHAYYDVYDDQAGFNTFVCHVYGAILGWGRTIHHETYFRTETALPIALMEVPEFSILPAYRVPEDDLRTQAARTRLREVSTSLCAPIFDDLDELEAYTKKEAAKW